MKRKRAALLTLRTRRQQPPFPPWARLLLGALFVLVVVLVGWSIQHHDALVRWRSALSESGAPTPWPLWNAGWPPLPPRRGSTAQTVMGDWQGPYAYAALNPEKLRFIPCYCGCRREGHRSVLDCFLKGTTPNGMPIWNEHGFTCQTCVNVLREVLFMSRQGMSLAAIRVSIDEHHGGFFSTSTATPPPQ